MKKLKGTQILLLVLACYLLLALGFYLIAGEQLHVRDEQSDMLTPAMPIGEITQDTVISQRVTARCDEITGVTLRLSTYARENDATLHLTLKSEEGAILAAAEVAMAEIRDNSDCTVYFAEEIPAREGQAFYLELTTPDGAPGNTVSAWWGNSLSTARVEVKQDIPAEDLVMVNGVPQNGALCFRLHERNHLWVGRIYWYVAAALGLLLLGYGIYLLNAQKKGKSCLPLRLAAAFRRYGFLMRQLIARDFKTKYKRSVLGVFWSFLNPLLTMLVQYIVFSTLFKTDIPNFALYLLTGIVCFNFFNESSTMALQSIVGNATLITKVYVPKYIYPVSRVLSSTINLLLSMIPLLAVMLLTGTPVRPAILLLPFGIICLLFLCVGMGLLLSTLMVFFRDTQFLWGVLSMLWMYATPIFYPESIIPGVLMPLYKCNPLYHIIRFLRIVLMDGISPEPKAYLLCLIASVVPLVIGAVVFKKNQDRFVLNL